MSGGLRQLGSRWVLLAGLLGGGAAPMAAPLTIFVEPYPPFVQEQQGIAKGPYVEALRQLAAGQNLPLTIQAVPIRRALQLVEEQPNTCVLALNYSAATAEVLLYLGRVAPMYIWAYARHGEIPVLNRLEDLRRYSVGGIDIAEVRELLDGANIGYQPLQFSGQGLKMLGARRFDILLSDVSPGLNSNKDGVAVDKVLLVTRVERWIACQRTTPPATLASLRTALREGLFAESVQPIWARYGLDSYFQQVRHEWSATAKP